MKISKNIAYQDNKITFSYPRFLTLKLLFFFTLQSGWYIWEYTANNFTHLDVVMSNFLYHIVFKQFVDFSFPQSSRSYFKSVFNQIW